MKVFLLQGGAALLVLGLLLRLEGHNPAVIGAIFAGTSFATTPFWLWVFSHVGRPNPRVAWWSANVATLFGAGAVLIAAAAGAAGFLSPHAVELAWVFHLGSLMPVALILPPVLSRTGRLRGS